ncbi:MAG: DUF1819 family protein [Myxococcota bacterium]|jgi:hypothetical protein|nr:DUF1819 family protein [Myxococcota bacterium]
MKGSTTPLPSVLAPRGPYAARNIIGPLLRETGLLFEALAQGRSVEEAHRAAMDGSLFPQRSRSSRKRFWSALHARYLVDQPGWAMQELVTRVGADPSSPESIGLLFLYFSLRDRISFEFVTGPLWGRWSASQGQVTPEAVLEFLDEIGEQGQSSHPWTEATRAKIASALLTSLRDFGLLRGARKKILCRPPLPLPTVEHLLRLMTAAGAKGRQVLEDPAWRLFLRTPAEVAHLLSQLAVEQRIRFEKVGRTVVLETPATWETSR